MIETPSLRTRLTLMTIGVVAILLVVLDGFVYLSLRDRLEGTLSEVLDARVALVDRLSEELSGAAELDAELTELGVPATVRDPDGQVLTSDPAARRFDQVPPATDLGNSSESRVLTLDDGTTVEVRVSRAGVDRTLQRVVVVELIGSLAALALAVALLYRGAAVVTRPLDRIVHTAHEISAGDLGRRLEPTDPTTELGRMAVAFDQMVDALDHAVTEARHAEVRSRRFLADAAHQLRTPLAGLRASADTLVAHPDGPDRERMTANLAREAARLSRLVGSLLRVAQLDRGEPPGRRPTDLTALVEEELERQRALAPSLDLHLDAGEPLPLVACSPDDVREALANLFDNARRFARTTVQVQLSAPYGAVEVRIRDDGPGLEPEEQGIVFDRFVSTDGGTGLGLPIARGIVQSHGGELSWQDGAFVLVLPVAGLDEPRRRA